MTKLVKFAGGYVALRFDESTRRWSRGGLSLGSVGVQGSLDYVLEGAKVDPLSDLDRTERANALTLTQARAL